MKPIALPLALVPALPGDVPFRLIPADATRTGSGWFAGPSRVWRLSRSLQRLLFIVGGAAALLALVALTVPMVVNLYKPRLEAVASDAMGMEVRVGGRLGMSFFPAFQVFAEDARILDAQGAAVASVGKIRLWTKLLPLFRGEFRLSRLELAHLWLSIERDPAGRLNVERLEKAAALLGALDGASVSLSNGTLLYADRRSGQEFEATDCAVAVRRMGLAGGRSSQRWKDLSVDAELACGTIRTKAFSVSALKASVGGSEGVFDLRPVTMGIFGAQAEGTVLADVTGPVPLYQVHCSLPGFRIEEFLKVLSPSQAAEGAMDFSANLSMQGETRSQMVRSMSGEISLRGGPLLLVGNDLDKVLSRVKSSRNFNLFDVGAVVLAGPLGLAVTKGYNFASLFRGTGGNSKIVTLVSDWRVERGVAQATDVALATAKNRIALQGGLDFVHQRFVDMIVASIDAGGCAKVRQAIRGSFDKPVVEEPRVLGSLTSLVRPFLKLYRLGRGLFPSGPCEVFYSGSVAAPATRSPRPRARTIASH